MVGSLLTDELESLCKEAVMWKRLDHLHIVPSVGVTLMSSWMPGEDSRDHVRKNPGTGRISLVSEVLLAWNAASFSPWLLNIAEGFTYLHSSNVIHGDLEAVHCIACS